MTDPNPLGLLPPLTQLCERRVRMLLQVRQQPGLQAGFLRARWPRPRRLGQTPSLPLPTTPARQRRRRYPKQTDHLWPGRPQIQCVQRPDPQISRIRLHAPQFDETINFQARRCTECQSLKAAVAQLACDVELLLEAIAGPSMLTQACVGEPQIAEGNSLTAEVINLPGDGEVLLV